MFDLKLCDLIAVENKSNNIPDSVKLEKSFSKILPDAWKNSQKSAVVGGGDGESKMKEDGDCKQLDEAGLKLEQGVPTS